LLQTSQKTFTSMVKELIDMQLMTNVGKETIMGPKKLYFPLQITHGSVQFAPNPPPKVFAKKKL
jgi:hypothetical protein